MHRLVTAFVVAGVFLAAACGGSGGSATASSTPSSSAVALISPTAASKTCPTAAKVDAALGVTLPKPTGVAGGSGGLPAGATGVTCEYHATAYNVLIELISNFDPSMITLYSNRFPVAFTNVAGVGDQARAFKQSLNGGKVNEGVVATKGRNLVLIIATATPATLAQVESLVNQLL